MYKLAPEGSPREYAVLYFTGCFVLLPNHCLLTTNHCLQQRIECHDGHEAVVAFFVFWCGCFVQGAWSKDGPGIGRPAVGVHGELVAHGDFGGFDFFPLDVPCGCFVVAQHADGVHHFGIVIDKFIDAVLVAFAADTDDLVRSVVLKKLG